MKFFSSNIKKFFIFSQKKAVLILQETETPKKFLRFYQKKAFQLFREMETPKKYLRFKETELSYISGNGNPKKLLIFQEVIFRAPKVKSKKKVCSEWSLMMFFQSLQQ